MDDFRREQKKQCPFVYTRNMRGLNRNRYGCECCMVEPLPKFKVTTRKLAKVRLKESDKKLFKKYMH